jgi:hypothetical protein
VAYPPIIKEDMGVRAAKFAAALRQANLRLIAVRDCTGKVRAMFVSADIKKM